jgi:hypothetical protein
VNIIFTLCSNNYLAQAKVLIDSLNKHNRLFKLVIGLVDELNDEVDYSFFSPATVIPVKELDLPNLPELYRKYNIVELNTCVKPTFFKYLKKRYNASNIIYLDPDIKVFSSLNPLLQDFNCFDILLTPHILTPIPQDDFMPQESIFLNHGIYNLGFIGLNMASHIVSDFLNWWEERTFSLGFNRLSEGLFVDQLWINLVPLLYPKVKIIREFGYNMAPWNLHERIIIDDNDNSSIVLNDNSQLTFYHFSSYCFDNPSKICKEYYNRYSFENRPDLKNIYNCYQLELTESRVAHFSTLNCSFYQLSSETIVGQSQEKDNTFRVLLKNITPKIIINLTKRLI